MSIIGGASAEVTKRPVPKKGIFYGWWIVLATSVIHFVGAGIFVYSFTAFFNPLVQEFKWSYTATSFASSFRSLESGIAAPIVGFLSDKIGPSKLMLTGAAWAGAMCLLLSRINSLWSFYITFFFLSVGASLMFPLPGWTAIANWFSRKRGMAIGIAVAALGASGALIPLVNWLIGQYGWRETFVIAGTGILIIGIPLALVVKHHPEQQGYLPDGEVCPGEEAETGQRQTRPSEEASGFSAREVTKTSAFWILAIASTFTAASSQALTVHVMPCLISIQMPREVASSIAASLVVSSVAGRLGFGWLGDRFDKRYLMSIAILMQALGLIIFAYTTSLPHAISFLALFGPGFGGLITLRLGISVDYFGRKAFGSTQGMMQAIHMVLTILSPVFAGWIYDTQGSYRLAWLALALLMFLTIPMLLALKSPKEPALSSV